MPKTCTSAAECADASQLVVRGLSCMEASRHSQAITINQCSTAGTHMYYRDPYVLQGPKRPAHRYSPMEDKAESNPPLQPASAHASVSSELILNLKRAPGRTCPPTNQPAFLCCWLGHAHPPICICISGLLARLGNTHPPASRSSRRSRPSPRTPQQTAAR